MTNTLIAVPACEPNAIARAADILRRGGLVAFPTETVYGLGANALDPAAVARIFAAKGRPATNPVIVHVGTVADASQLVTRWPERADQLAARFWPGPLTLVLPRAPQIPDVVTGGGPTVALRLPAHPVAQALLAAAGVPIAAPSANRSTQLSPTLAEHVRQDFAGQIDMILDGGPCSGGIESTVLDVSVTPPRLLRPGLLNHHQLEEVVGVIDQGRFEVAPLRPSPSPGMQARHYAPRTPLEPVEGDSQERVAQLLASNMRVGWLSLRPATLTGPDLHVVAMPISPAEYGACLYATLHDLDRAGLQRIVVEMPPDSSDWLAIRDRLRRAAAPADATS